MPAGRGASERRDGPSGPRDRRAVDDRPRRQGQRAERDVLLGSRRRSALRCGLFVSSRRGSTAETPAPVQPLKHMWRLHTLLSALRKGPHGDVTLGAAIISIVVLVLLLTGVVYRPLWTSAVTVAVVAVLMIQTVAILLLNRLRAKLNDVHYAVSLENGLRRAGYGLNDFFTDEAAANPSLQLLL